MLVLKLERWPQGDPKRKVQLGQLYIANDESGSDAVGSYEVSLALPERDRVFASIKNFPRGPSPTVAWRLVLEALKRVLSISR